MRSMGLIGHLASEYGTHRTNIIPVNLHNEKLFTPLTLKDQLIKCMGLIGQIAYEYRTHGTHFLFVSVRSSA